MATRLTALPSEVGDTYPKARLEFTSGDSVDFDILIQDPDPDSPDPENPVMIPRNLTGWSGRGEIRKSAKKDAELWSTFMVTVVEPASSGLLHVSLTPEESSKARKAGGWDIELTSPSGHVETIMGGPVDPEEDYTQ